MARGPTRRAVTAGAGLLATPALGARQIVLDDASGLDATPVARHWTTSRPVGEALIARLRAELKAAKAEGRPVAVGGARHSMGGQSLARGGTAIDFAASAIETDVAGGLYRVPAGARWRQVIAQLDPIGWSPTVMQSNNDFSVGGTFSVNAHGWAVPYPPMGSTVRQVRLMLADGTIVTCSRTKEPELFGLAMGGYGLMGVILDLEVTMHPNILMLPRAEVIPSDRIAEAFRAALFPEHGVRMAYGRLSVAREGFLEAAAFTQFTVTGQARPGEGGKAPAWIAAITRDVYRAQVGSEAWKRARWIAETRLAPLITADVVSRNAALNTPVAALAGRDPRRTDILHEYFLPPERLEAFLAACRRIIPGAGPDLLNVTLRWLQPDALSVLAYAPGQRIAAVMSFSQTRTAAGEAAMRRMTERLIDAALAEGGSYYLPYRLHARREQLARAYPGAAAFGAAKRRYDPGQLFRNALWDHYWL